jgi:hypothetical protein
MKALQKPATFKETLTRLAQGGFVRKPGFNSKYGEVLNSSGTFLAVITEHTYHELVMTLSGCARYGHNEKNLDVRGIVYRYMAINGDFNYLADKLISKEHEWNKERAKQLETTT